MAELDSHLQVLLQVLLLDLLLRGQVQVRDVGVLDLQFAHDVLLLLLGLLQRQVSVVEQVVEVVCHAVFLQVVVLDEYTLLDEGAGGYLLGATGDDHLLDLVLELDLLFARLEFDQLHVPDHLAREFGRQRASESLLADQDTLALVLEERTHDRAHVADGLVEEDVVDLGRLGLLVVALDLFVEVVLDLLLFVGEVVILPLVLDVGEHEEGLGLQLLLAALLQVELLHVGAFEVLQLLLLEHVHDDVLHVGEVVVDVLGIVESVQELAVEFVL